MRWWITVLIIFAAALSRAGDDRRSSRGSESLCTYSWYKFIEDKVATSDEQNHGPDVGSDEWKSVVEFKLGLRGQSDLPRRNSEAWCRDINQLVPGYSPFRFICDGDPAKEVIITFLQSDPSSLVAEFDGSVALMYVQTSGSGTRYQGKDKTFWEHQGEATITWGDDMPKMLCKQVP